jgi:probable addiction module antidote protein
MAKVKKKKKPSYHEDLINSLKDPEEAIAYLRAALDEIDAPEVFLLALRNVAEARGMSKLARDAQLNREHLYSLLSKNGNPELASLYAILSALGYKFSVNFRAA